MESLITQKDFRIVIQQNLTEGEHYWHTTTLDEVSKECFLLAKKMERQSQNFDVDALIKWIKSDKSHRVEVADLLTQIEVIKLQSKPKHN